MSVHKMRPGAYRVRWREGGVQRSKVFQSKALADRVDAKLKDRKAAGSLGVFIAGEQTFKDFVEEWSDLYLPLLAPATQDLYTYLHDCHLEPRIGKYLLLEITPETITRLRRDLERAGVGRVATAKALTLLHGMLERAVELGRIEHNPARSVRKPSTVPTRTVRPLPPAVVESVRARLRPRDATLVSVLAYGGLRPKEASALRWRAIRDRTILIEPETAKTRRRRTVCLLGPLASDLAAWRLAQGRPDDSELVFPATGGGMWTKEIRANWRRRIYQPVAKKVNVVEASRHPYALRHSFVSLLIHEGVSVVEVARQAGHSAAECLRTYAHIFEEFDPAERMSAEERIRRAREELPRLAAV